MKKDGNIPMTLFKQNYITFCITNNLGKPKLGYDQYNGPFSANEIVVRKATVIYNGQKYTNKDIVYGVDILEDVNQFDRDECLINEM